MNEKIDLNSSTRTDKATEQCSIGGCGGPGLCPGVAVLLAYLVGGSITLLTGLTWLGWTIGVPLAIILITGAWRLLPKRSSS